MKKLKKLLAKSFSTLRNQKKGKVVITIENKQDETAVKSKMYNLIIIDESGSMGCIQPQVVTGCNETLQTIRAVQKRHPNQEHYVSIYFFDTNSEKSRYIIKNRPINRVADIKPKDYRPNGMTPLYDAMGTTITELQNEISGKEESYAMVTVITDGYENASTEYSGKAIQKLVEECKENGWVFTFIGANIDVKGTAANLAIENSLLFAQDEEGTERMFQMSASCRSFYYDEFEKHRREDEVQKKSFFAKMNQSFFEDDKMEE